MKSDNLLRHIAVPLVIAVLVYVIFYTGIEHRRTRKGPWQVAFTNSASGAPTLVINQPVLGITNVQISFAGQTNEVNPQASAFDFSQPREVPYDVSFGKCVFMDTTFLPGTIVFDVFGHEIQVIPRVLTIDQKEMPWRSNETMVLAKTNVVEQPVR